MSEQGGAEPDDSSDDDSPQLRKMQRMVDLAVERTNLAHERTRMAADRSEFSANRSYMAAERTLSVWVRTALALVTLGIAIDRFGLYLLEVPGHPHAGESDMLSAWGGAGLVAFGVLMAITTGIRFLVYVRAYRRFHTVPTRHGPYLAPSFAGLTALFGTGVLILLLVVG
jgi:putative membrane protein